MEVCPDLCVACGAEIAQYPNRARLDGDLMAYEVGGPHSQAIEEPCQPRELADVADRHAIAAAVPVVFFRVDRDNDNRLACHGACVVATMARWMVARVRTVVRAVPWPLYAR